MSQCRTLNELWSLVIEPKNKMPKQIRYVPEVSVVHVSRTSLVVRYTTVLI
jgi:hypothetical protein